MGNSRFSLMQNGIAFVEKDPYHPGFEQAVIAELVPLLPCLADAFLHGVFTVARLREQAVGYPVQRFLQIYNASGKIFGGHEVPPSTCAL